LSTEGFHRALEALLVPSSDFKTAIGGRFQHQDDVPSSWAMPYASWLTVYSEPQDTFSAKIDGKMIQVNIFAATRLECVRTADKAKTLFDGAVLSGAGIQPARLVRGAEHGPEKTEDGGRQMILEFTVHVQTS
jgi:hypothetical protein